MIKKIISKILVLIILLLLIFIIVKIIYIFYSLLPISFLSVIKHISNEPKNEWQLKTEAEIETRFNKWKEDIKLKEQQDKEKIKHDHYIIGQAWRQTLLWSWIACWILWWYLWKDEGYP
jgi:predicted Holliday junction resolvase-like endonuclease